MSNAASAVPAPRLTVPAGTLVDDKYRLERFLGQGDMGCVFLVTHVLTGESLALKVLYPVDPSQGPAAFAAFIVAARVAARFRSEHVAHVRDMGLLEDGGPFLVMDYFQGETLETHLRKRGPLAIGEAVDLALQAARGLSEAHEAGVVHRDAKPSNWFLTETPDGSTRVKLLDFGVAKIAPRAGSAEEPSPSGPGQVGWIPYAAPEQIRSPAAVDGRADIWTVGVVLHEMLAGATPSGRSTMRQARDRALMASRPWLRQTEGPVSAELEDGGRPYRPQFVVGGACYVHDYVVEGERRAARGNPPDSRGDPCAGGDGRGATGIR
jgi:serine/threonine-protein kinase